MKFLIAFTLTALLTTTAFADPTGNPQYKHPVIQDHGGIVTLPNAARFATSEVASDVKVAVSAATVNVNLQMDGYAYIPFK